MKSYLPFLMLILIFSCGKESEDIWVDDPIIEALEINYFVFGKFYQECFGHEDCVKFFKLENGQLFEDNDSISISSENWFTNIPLEDWKVLRANELIKEFPNTLFESDEEVYGCPDCSDQGGYYLKLQIEDEERIWMIDVYDEEQNQEIIDYKNKIEEVLDEL